MKMACIGAGVIGRSWALLFALRGNEVVLYDISNDILDDALKTIEAYLKTLRSEAVIKNDETINYTLKRIKITVNFDDAVRDVSYIQESVPEDLDLKKRIFKEMDAKTPSSTILASSTSGLSISEIQQDLRNPERCIIVHPINPPHLIPLVEIVPGDKTSESVVRKTYDLMSKLGKVPVIVRKEVPGFIFNRLAAALWREALDLIDNNVATVEDIDKVVSAGLGLRWAVMGPFLTYHFGGGRGGLEYFIDHLGKSFSMWWSTMATWTSIPYTAAKKAIKGVKDMEVVKRKSFEELLTWRDKRLIKIVKLLYPESVIF